MDHHVLCVRTDRPTEVSEERFHRWYDEEHIPERLGVPGFRWAVRYVNASTRGLRYMVLYALEDADVLQSDEYTRLSNPEHWTPETKLIFPRLREIMERSVLRVRCGVPRPAERLTVFFGTSEPAAGVDIERWAEASDGRAWLSGDGMELLMAVYPGTPPAGFRELETVTYERALYAESFTGADNVTLRG